MKHLTTRKEIWDMLWRFIPNTIRRDLAENLIWAFDSGRVESISVADNTNPMKMRWDGALYVHFADKPDTKWMVNQLVFPSKADEISMEDEKTLRLWWD